MRRTFVALILALSGCASPKPLVYTSTLPTYRAEGPTGEGEAERRRRNGYDQALAAVTRFETGTECSSLDVGEAEAGLARLRAAGDSLTGIRTIDVTSIARDLREQQLNLHLTMAVPCGSVGLRCVN